MQRQISRKFFFHQFLFLSISISLVLSIFLTGFLWSMLQVGHACHIFCKRFSSVSRDFVPFLKCILLHFFTLDGSPYCPFFALSSRTFYALLANSMLDARLYFTCYLNEEFILLPMHNVRILITVFWNSSYVYLPLEKPTTVHCKWGTFIFPESSVFSRVNNHHFM